MFGKKMVNGQMGKKIKTKTDSMLTGMSSTIPMQWSPMPRASSS